MLLQNHLRINSVDGKHSMLSLNHISSDLEGHQVQERNFKFGTISLDLAYFIVQRSFNPPICCLHFNFLGQQIALAHIKLV